MPTRAKLYITLVIGAGGLAFLNGLLHWDCPYPVRFAGYFLVAALGSGFKVGLPGIFGTISASFLFVQVGIVYLTLPETLLLGAASVLVQCFWKAKVRPKPLHVLFNLSSLSITITVCYSLVHLAWLSLAGIELPLRLVLLACAYFVLNTLPVALAIALTTGTSVKGSWMCCFWSFPYYLVGAAVVGLFSIATRFMGWQTSLLVLPFVYVIFRSYRLYLGRLETEKKRAEEQREHAEQMAALHLRTIEALALAIEAKDHTTFDHLARVQVYAYELGKELNLSELELNALRAAALLHDIGKLAVPEYIISKPGRLSPEEFEKMKVHPVVGAEILERVQFPYPVVPIVAAHHEKWDGSGYPAGLQGEAIPIGARILAAVDCLDALVSDRQYRRAMPIEEAMAVVASQAGKAFDPQVVDILQRRYRKLEEQVRATSTKKAASPAAIKTDHRVAPAAGYEAGGESKSRNRRGQSVKVLSSMAATRRDMQKLFEPAQDSGHPLTLGENFAILAMRLKRAISFDVMAVYLASNNKLTPAYVSGGDLGFSSSLEIPIGQGLSGWVAENGKSIVNGNPAVEPGPLGNAAKAGALQSALSIPLDGLGGMVGVLTLYHSRKDAFTRDHLCILLAITPRLALSVESYLNSDSAEGRPASSLDHQRRLAPNGFGTESPEIELCGTTAARVRD